jgi:hypothetical protein
MPPKELVGLKFGKLLVLAQDKDFLIKNKYIDTGWLCRCDCGVEKVVRRSLLIDTTRPVTSCGCARKKGSKKSGEYKGLHTTWIAMRHRCGNPKASDYKYYGGKGIKVCEEWENFEMFKSWALQNNWREGLTIDRINPNIGYEPSNCRWATMKTQNRNKEHLKKYEAFGESKLICEWAEDPRCVVSQMTLYNRIHLSQWNVEKALTAPLMFKFTH